MKYIYNIRDKMRQNGFNLIYEGIIDYNIIKEFSSLTEIKMEKLSEPTDIKKKVFRVLIECMQNIFFNYDKNEPGSIIYGKGMLIIGKYDNKYHIITGTNIENEKIDGLKNFINEITSLDKHELKELHKKLLSGEYLFENPQSDWASSDIGIGLINIIRNTGGNIKFEFIPVDDKNSFFIFKTEIACMN